MKRLIPLAALGLSMVLAAAVPASARPDYAKKEKRLCAYCHVDSKGGGPRNPRGVYYEAHNLTFTGFKEETQDAPKKTGPPAFQKSWQIDLPNSKP